MELPDLVRRAVCPDGHVLLARPGTSRAEVPAADFLPVPPGGLPRDGTVSGRLAGDAVFSHVSATFRAARLAEVKFELDCRADEHEPFARAIAAYWGLTLKAKGQRLKGQRALDALVPPSTLSLDAHVIDAGDPIYRLTLVASVDAPDALRADEPPLPLDALASLLATTTLPADACAGAVRASWASGNERLVPTAVRDALRALPVDELGRRTHALLALVDAHLHREPRATEEGLADTHVTQGGWLLVRPRVRLALVDALAGGDTRAPWLTLVTDALDLGRQGALDELVSRATQRRPVGDVRTFGVAATDLELDAPEAFNDALFAVATAGLPLEHVARFGVDERWPRTATRALERHLGPAPEFTTAQIVKGLGKKRAPGEENWRRASVARARFLAVARRLDDAVFSELLRRLSFDEAAVFLISDEHSVTLKKATYRVGERVLSWGVKGPPRITRAS